MRTFFLRILKRMKIDVNCAELLSRFLLTQQNWKIIWGDTSNNHVNKQKAEKNHEKYNTTIRYRLYGFYVFEAFILIVSILHSELPETVFLSFVMGVVDGN